MRDYAMMSLRNAFLKKFHNEEASDEANDRARALFLRKNEECREWSYPTGRLTEAEAIALGEAKSFLWSVCNPDKVVDGIHTPQVPLLSPASVDPGCGFGPGANIGARSGDPYGKLAITELTYTDPTLLVLFQQAARWYPLWSEQELFRSQRWGSREVQGSRLSFVPKTADITRTICTEPLLNMFFQKGISAVLEARLREVTGIDLRWQPDKNRELARIGSIDGSYGTIDLSSASDSMSRQLVREFFPRQFVSWLELTRSPYTTLDSGEAVELQMVSSMGNAYTFPLQTLFFTSLVVGAYRVLDIPVRYPRGHRLGNFAVFGDDIIVCERAYKLVCRLLSHCGFTVNDDKSFNTGHFRESCGRDYYCGHDVRGVYLKKLLDDADCYSAANRLYRWCAKHEVWLFETLEYLHKRCKRTLFVPLDEDDEAGFKVPFRVAQRVVRQNRRSRNIHYTAATRRKLVVRLPVEALKEGDPLLKRLRGVIPCWDYNPAGMMLLFLHGNIRDGRLTLRSECKELVYKKRHSPRWDYGVFDGPEMGRVRGSYHDFLSLVWYD